jgi:hypothetical protein
MLKPWPWPKGQILWPWQYKALALVFIAFVLYTVNINTHIYNVYLIVSSGLSVNGLDSGYLVLSQSLMLMDVNSSTINKEV